MIKLIFYYPKVNILLAVMVCLLLQSCDRPVAERRYHEMIVDVPAPQPLDQTDPHAFLSMMPEDDIHRNLKTNEGNLNNRLAESVAPAAITWTTPEEWLEKKGDGMRLASFINSDKDFPVETTIISLAGQAGGIPANITRWLQQLNIALPVAMDMDQFISRQEKMVNPSGLELMVVDFTLLQTGPDDQQASMLAAVIDRKASQIFIKMTGSKAAVLKSYAAFKSLIMSIKAAE